MSEPDERLAFGVRLSVFVAVLVAAGAMVWYVATADSARRADAGRGADTVVTYEPPLDPGTTGTTVSPSNGNPRTFETGPPTGSSIAIEIAKSIQRETGWTHKVWCEPSGALEVGAVLECRADTEPPIDEQPPSAVIAVLVDGDGTTVLVRGEVGAPGHTIKELLGEPELSCEELSAGGFPYVSVVAYSLLHGDPGQLVEPSNSERAVVELAPALAPLPCTDTYGVDVVAAALGAVVG